MPQLTLPIYLLLLFGLLLSKQVTSDELKGQAPALQLANVYYSDIPLQDYWVSEKLDGVRAYWNGRLLVSKQGHIYQAPKWFTANLPAFDLDGELWLGRAQFDSLSGIVRKQVPIDKEWQKVSYQVFDLPESNADFDGRLEYLKAYFSGENIPTWLKLIPQYKLKNEQDLQSKLEHIDAQQGEGLMLHKGTSFYHAGRGDDLLKLKTYQDAEAKVIGYSAGKGKYRGLTGALLVEASNQVQKGKIFKIGSGLADADRRMPPKVGSIITYKYLGLTSKGLPRFASFMRVRNR